jgi:signal transduction histidine kinase
VILLVTGSSRAQECVAAIEKKTHQKTMVACSPAKAAESLQTHEFDTLVMDESFQQVDSASENLVIAQCGSALPIYVNLALHGADRVATLVSCGLQRLVRERTAAMRAATNELRNELRGEVTAILLNTELALREKALAPGAVEKLSTVHETADRMRRKLEDRPDERAGVSVKPRLVNRQPAAPAGR